MNRIFGVLGGDRRYAELVRLLQRDGYTARTYGVEPDSGTADTWERVLSADVVLLPMPLCGADGRLNCPGLPLPMEELFSRLRPEQTVLAGGISADAARLAEEAGISPVDYMTREPMAVANAAATADAALSLTVIESRAPLTGKRCLVLGFGRIGKLLCQRLRGVGASVTATARNPADLAWIRALGLPALHTEALTGHLDTFDIVYNTVPAPVLDAALLNELPPDCFLMDLASRTGIDLEAASRLGLTSVWARGLPGKVVPRGAAVILRDTVYEILRERGDPA